MAAVGNKVIFITMFQLIVNIRLTGYSIEHVSGRVSTQTMVQMRMGALRVFIKTKHEIEKRSETKKTPPYFGAHARFSYVAVQSF